MDLNSITKYARQAVPFAAAGKSQAQITARALIKQAKGKERSASEDAALSKFEEGINKPQNNKLVAHVATKLLSSRDAMKEPKVSQKGAELLASLERQSPEAKTTALHQVFSHYKSKQVQRNVAGALLGASAVATLGAFAGAGAAGFIPLIAGVIPSATAFAKSRKVGHRLAALTKQGVEKKEYVKWKNETKAAAAQAKAAPAQAEAAPAQPAAEPEQAKAE